MKSLCSTGLTLFLCLGWAASAANAQTGGGYGTPSLLPLPSALPPISSTQTVGYYDNAQPEPYNSPFAMQTSQPATGATGAPILPPTMSDTSGAPSCGGCNSCNSCSPTGGAMWFGAGGGLVMGRGRANPFWTTYQTNNNPNQLMNTQNAVADWAGGGQITVGRFWCCGTGLAFTYWGLGQMNGFSEVTDQTGNINTALSSPINLGGVNIGAFTAGQFFDNAHQQRIWRADNIQNFEVNALQAAWVNTEYFQLVGIAGFRYFRFDEQLTYGSVAFGNNFGDNGGADEAYLRNRVINNLYGAQVGALGNFMLTQRLGWYIMPKVGLFANQMNGRTQLYSGDGTFGTVGSQTFDISAHKNDVALLGEIDTGFSWAITPGVRALVGYRVIGISNLALSDNQFLPYLADTAGFAQIKQNGAIIIHGATAGVVWMF
jgi:hypothetical protein